MSWGAWVLMLVTPLSFIWSAIHIREIFPNWDWKFKILKDLEAFFIQTEKGHRLGHGNFLHHPGSIHRDPLLGL